MKQRSRRYQSADICIVWAGKYVLKFRQESLTFQKEEHTVILFNVYQIIRAELKKNMQMQISKLCQEWNIHKFRNKTNHQSQCSFDTSLCFTVILLFTLNVPYRIRK